MLEYSRIGRVNRSVVRCYINDNAPVNVYFISASSPLTAVVWIKVGKAGHPPTRLREMQVGCPLTLTVIGLIKCYDNESSLWLERKLINSLDWKRARGEWFVAPENYIEVVTGIVKQWDLKMGRNPKQIALVNY